MVRQPDATMQPTPQDNQLMSKHHVLSFKPQLRLEWRGQHRQNETEQPDHFASLGDSIAPSTPIRFSVHTGNRRNGYGRRQLSHQCQSGLFRLSDPYVSGIQGHPFSNSDISATAWPLAVIGLALLGGLILNLMPCVLPALSIKLMGIVSKGGKMQSRSLGGRGARLKVAITDMKWRRR